ASGSGSGLGHFAANAFLNADLLRQSWYELRHPDFSSGWGAATFATAGVGLIAGGLDVLGNAVTLGGKGLLEGGIKAGIKDVVEVGAKEAVETGTRQAGRIAAEGTTYLYQKVGTAGEHLKFGITDNP